MTSNAEQVRLAITVFDDPERLWSTVLMLLCNGLTHDQLCLVALAKKMKGSCLTYLQKLSGEERDRLTSFCEAVEEWADAGSERVVATSGALLGSLRQAQDPRTGNGTGRQDLSFAWRTADLENHIGQGAIVLVARAASPAQQTVVTRALLSGSLHRVTTFEFAATQR